MDYFSKYLKYKTKYHDLKEKIAGTPPARRELGRTGRSGVQPYVPREPETPISQIPEVSFPTTSIMIAADPNNQEPFKTRAQRFLNSKVKPGNDFHLTLLTMWVNESFVQPYKDFIEIINSSGLINNWNMNFTPQDEPGYGVMGKFYVKKYNDVSNTWVSFVNKIFTEIDKKFGSYVNAVRMKSMGQTWIFFNHMINFYDPFGRQLIVPLYGLPEYIVNLDGTLKPFIPHVSICKLLWNSPATASIVSGNRRQIDADKSIKQEIIDNTIDIRNVGIGIDYTLEQLRLQEQRLNERMNEFMQQFCRTENITFENDLPPTNKTTSNLRISIRRWYD